MSGRQKILDAIKRNQPTIPDTAPININGISYPDVSTQFSAVLTAIGGVVVQVPSLGEVAKEINARFPNAKRKVSMVNSLYTAEVNDSLPSNPHHLENVDVAVIQGMIGVAENGAI